MLLIVSYIVNRLPCPFIFSRGAKIQNLLILNPQIQASPAPRFAGAPSPSQAIERENALSGGLCPLYSKNGEVTARSAGRERSVLAFCPPIITLIPFYSIIGSLWVINWLMCLVGF
jgi:hypothetical protein